MRSIQITGLLVALLAAIAAADTVVKKDGSRIEGKIVERKDGFVVVETADGARKLVLSSEIEEILESPLEATEDPAPAPTTPDATPDAAPEEEVKSDAGRTEVVRAPPPDLLALPEDISVSARKLYEKGAALVKSAQDAKRPGERASLASQAISPLTQAYRKVRGFHQAYYQLGIAHQIAGDDDKGRKALRDALALQPNFYQAMVEIADILNRDKEFDEARRFYDRALEVAPDYVLGLTSRALFCTRLRQMEQAKADLDRALELEPDNEMAKGLLEQVKKDLEAPAWENVYRYESEHYEVETSVSDEFARQVADTAESAYELYDLLFDAAESRQNKFAIICYDSQKQYVEAGSPPNTGGYYSPLIKKLVLFRYEHWEDTLNVINHEGFHQYLDMYLQGAPQWFNEGHGDFFGFATYERGRLMPRPNAWRLKAIQTALKSNREQPLSRLLVMSHQQMYNPRTIGTNYAQAWSFVFFLWTYNGGAYRPLLSKYFKLLRKGADIEQVYDAVFKGRIDQLESQWKTYTRALKLSQEDIELLKRKKKGTGIGE